MRIYDRRGFLQFTTAATAAAVAEQLFAAAPVDPPKKAFRLGLLANASDNLEQVIAHVHELGLPTAHVSMREFSDDMAPRLRSTLDRYEVEATVFISSGPGEEHYDLVEGPLISGLVSARYRRERIDHLKRASDFAKLAGIPAVFNQWGYIPEVPSDPLYEPTVEAVREIASHCRGNGQMFFNETGQETPITLLRTIQDAGMDNVRICLDAANLVLYGKGNPVDALDVLGKYVHAVHAKGGFYPADPRYIGKQVPAHEPNKVDWPLLIRRLKEIGYDGPVTIEAVTRGPERDRDIQSDRAYLENLIAQG
jgi:L-ribulose-5-phosphate 3-epimerase